MGSSSGLECTWGIAQGGGTVRRQVLDRRAAQNNTQTKPGAHIALAQTTMVNAGKRSMIMRRITLLLL